MSSLFDNALEIIKENRFRKINGFDNCIPWGFPRFEMYNPGIEKAKYYLITANTKVGKSQATDYLFVLNPIIRLHMNPVPQTQSCRILYFSLEMSSEEKAMLIMCYLLNLKFNIRINIRMLQSVYSPVSEALIQRLESFRAEYTVLEERIIFYDNIRDPESIKNEIDKYALANGRFTFKEERAFDNSIIKVRDKYFPNNPEEYVIPIVDNYNILEFGKATDLAGAIANMSAYAIAIKKLYKYSFVGIQQQMQANESLLHKQAGADEPSLSGLGDNKKTGRDCDFCFGIYSPARNNRLTHGIGQFKYDVTRLGDYYRSLSIIAGRQAGGGSEVGLFYDGATNTFRELPKADNLSALEEWYRYTESLISQNI